LNTRAQTLVDLADVLERSDRAGHGADALTEALVLFERKGNTVMAERVRERVAVSREAAG
jgi:hypothetical protein